MGARLSTIKRVSSNNVPGDMLIASEDEDRSIRRIPSIRYLKKRRGSVNKTPFTFLLISPTVCQIYHDFYRLSSADLC